MWWNFEQIEYLEETTTHIHTTTVFQITVPVGAVWSGSTLFAQAYLSENLGSLR